MVGFVVNDAVKWELIGENAWSQHTRLEKVGPAFAQSVAWDLSNDLAAVAVGTSTDLDGIHGVVWDVPSGNIIGDLGAFGA